MIHTALEILRSLRSFQRSPKFSLWPLSLEEFEMTAIKTKPWVLRVSLQLLKRPAEMLNESERLEDYCGNNEVETFSIAFV